jgi:hypothetical protein
LHEELINIANVGAKVQLEKIFIYLFLCISENVSYLQQQRMAMATPAAAGA